MQKQALVVGLGQFGMALTRSLTERGVEVIAVDSDPDHVRQAADIASEAVELDATDEAALNHVVPERRDVCVCAIGEQSRESSIICTALLRQMGARYLVARATDPLHERILRLVGAHVVVNPERAFGERLATRLLYAGVLDELPLGEDLVISELKPPDAILGRTLAELELPRRYGITIVALRHAETSSVVMPSPRQSVREGDLLIVVSRPGAVASFLDRV